MARKDFRTIRRGRKVYSLFEVEGLDELERDLKRMGKELATEKGKAAARAAMQPVAADVTSNIIAERAVDTAALKNSVRQVVRQDRRGIASDVRAGVSRRGRYVASGEHKPAYALQVEFGTSTHKERPFMRPAFDGHETEIAFRLRKLLRQSVVFWRAGEKIRTSRS